MSNPWQPSREFSSGCLFMASVFAFTSIYKLLFHVDKVLSLWVPLHVVAAIVSCFHAFRVSRWSRMIANGLLIGSTAVIFKEVAGHVTKGCLNWQAFASLDMHKHHVREKIGSALVLLAVGLQLDAYGGVFPSKKQMMVVTASSTLCAAYLIQALASGDKELPDA